MATSSPKVSIPENIVIHIAGYIPASLLYILMKDPGTSPERLLIIIVMANPKVSITKNIITHIAESIPASLP